MNKDPAQITVVIFVGFLNTPLQQEMACQYHETPEGKAWISITCSAPINMAVVKYWGKRDEELILPVNSSLSATLHQDDLKTVTSIIAGDFDADRIWLNGK